MLNIVFVSVVGTGDAGVAAASSSKFFSKFGQDLG